MTKRLINAVRTAGVAIIGAATLMGAYAEQETYRVLRIIGNDGKVETRYVKDINKIEFDVVDSPELPPVEETAMVGVDLGLSVKWGNINIGATSVSDPGNFYAWGELTTKEDFTLENYRWFDSFNDQDWIRISTNISGTAYDVAKKVGGDGWQMPSLAQWRELFNNTTKTWETINGVSGMRFTADNGNSIFIPAAGRLMEGSNGYENTTGFYWCGELIEDDAYGNYRAGRANIHANYQSAEDTSGDTPFIGMSVRGVLTDAEEEMEKEPGEKEMVDLGLSVKWAAWNLGATSPGETGDYYMWGAKPSSTFGDPSYEHCLTDGSGYCEDLGEHIAGTKYDMATQRWGDGWRLPTKAEMQELITSCTWTSSYADGHAAVCATAPNGNKIYFVYSGTMGIEGQFLTEYGDYWSDESCKRSDTGDYTSYFAWRMRFKKDGSSIKIDMDNSFKSLGRLIRPVHD